MKEEVKQLILSGDFKRAKQFLVMDKPDFLRQIILELGFDDGSISAYSLICFLLTDNETSYHHYMASELLSTALCHLPDAYSCALFHARRSVELSPQDVSLKEHLLLFHAIPEQLINKEEAEKIAKEILKQKPSSVAAHSVLNNHNKLV